MPSTQKAFSECYRSLESVPFSTWRGRKDRGKVVMTAQVQTVSVESFSGVRRVTELLCTLTLGNKKNSLKWSIP